MAQIFISHVHEEAEIAKAVLRFLRYFGLEAFLSSDELQINPGQRWFDRIITELTNARVVLLLLSNVSVLRPWINFEAGWAWGTERTVIPVCFGGLTKGAMPRPYSDLQGVNLRTDYFGLLKGCGHAVGHTTPPPGFAQSTVDNLITIIDDFELRHKVVR